MRAAMATAMAARAEEASRNQGEWRSPQSHAENGTRTMAAEAQPASPRRATSHT